MKRSTFARDLIGTFLVFLALVIITFIIMNGEHFLDNFKAH
jgi:hypothetical protein